MRCPNLLGQEAKARPGRQHMLDAAYFARVDAIQFTIAHDDGIGAEDWEECDIVLAGVSRSSKTPTSIYLANRGYKTANIPIVVESPPPPELFTLKHPLIVGLTTSADRLVQIRRNRLLSLNQAARDPMSIRIRCSASSPMRGACSPTMAGR
jgi:regulator of PEP synthase PpsR (kinase-PPPase family)